MFPYEPSFHPDAWFLQDVSIYFETFGKYGCNCIVKVGVKGYVACCYLTTNNADFGRECRFACVL